MESLILYLSRCVSKSFFRVQHLTRKGGTEDTRSPNYDEKRPWTIELFLIERHVYKCSLKDSHQPMTRWRSRILVWRYISTLFRLKIGWWPLFLVTVVLELLLFIWCSIFVYDGSDGGEVRNPVWSLWGVMLCDC